MPLDCASVSASGRRASRILKSPQFGLSRSQRIERRHIRTVSHRNRTRRQRQRTLTIANRIVFIRRKNPSDSVEKRRIVAVQPECATVVFNGKGHLAARRVHLAETLLGCREFWLDRDRCQEVLDAFVQSALGTQCSSQRPVSFGVPWLNLQRDAEMLFRFSIAALRQKRRRVVVPSPRICGPLW